MYTFVKRWAFVTAILVVLAFSTSKEATAQFWIGGGLVYGETIGVQANGHLVVNEDNNLRIGVDISYFVREKDERSEGAFEAEVKTNLVELNVNAHYMLVNGENTVLYAIGGLSFGFVSNEISANSEDIVSFFEQSVPDNETDIGINIGGGLEVAVPFGRAYGEIKYVLGAYNQLVVGAGVRIPILGGGGR
jgi:opacity protein-like surface antigen